MKLPEWGDIFFQAADRKNLVNFSKKCLTCVCKSDKVYICQRVVRRCATELADDVGRCPSG